LFRLKTTQGAYQPKGTRAAGNPIAANPERLTDWLCSVTPDHLLLSVDLSVKPHQSAALSAYMIGKTAGLWAGKPVIDAV
jgi:hypothetical protein